MKSKISLSVIVLIASFPHLRPYTKPNGLIWAEPGKRALVRYPNTAAVATKCRLE